MFREESIEKNLINKIGKIVDVIIELSGEQELMNIEKYREDAVRELQEAIPLMLYVLDGKKEHLEAMIRQMISQKLPENKIINAFGNLQNEISLIIKLSLEKYNFSDWKNYSQKEIEKINTQHNNTLNDEISIVYNMLLKLLPNEDIIRGYKLRSFSFPFYIKRYNLIIDFADNIEKYSNYKDLLCRQVGIKLIIFRKEYLQNQKQFNKILKKYVI